MNPLKTMDPAELSWELTQKVAEFDPEFMPQLVVAIKQATAFHEGQWRKNRGHHQRTKYIEHPLRCALRAVGVGVTDRETILGTLFHDSVEDQSERVVALSGPDGPTMVRLANGDQQRLRDLALGWFLAVYGQDVADAIEGVTNPLEEPGTTKAERRRTYAPNVATKIRGRVRVFIIKLMDFADNGSGLHHNDVPGNEKMVAHLAIKYTPMPDIFLEEMILNEVSIARMMTAEGMAHMRTKLVNTKGRLAAIVARLGNEGIAHVEQA